MYTQWKFIEAGTAMRSNPQASPYLDEAMTFANFDPGMYEVVESFLPEPKQ